MNGFNLRIDTFTRKGTPNGVDALNSREPGYIEFCSCTMLYWDITNPIQLKPSEATRSRARMNCFGPLKKSWFIWLTKIAKLMRLGCCAQCQSSRTSTVELCARQFPFGCNLRFAPKTKTCHIPHIGGLLKQQCLQRDVPSSSSL